ncbi:MAG TPA: hypothetical protein VJB87_02790 [Candidatus Nanoarchaeia archaeon]|nr:hypothetical protein [Candidatus Nanoarchaeia archaeon]
MKTIEKALGELRRALLLSRLYTITINTLLTFLVIYFITTITNLPWYYSTLPTIIAAIYFTRKNLKSIKYQDVEQRVPLLKEKLRTAADNINKDNIIVNQLHQEVIKEMKMIRTSMFLAPLQSTYKMVLLGVIAFGIVFIAAMNVQLFDANLLIQDLGNYVTGNQKDLGEIDIAIQEGDDNIYGEESIVDYGNEFLDLGINTADGNLDYNKQKAASQLNFNGRYPTEEELQGKADSAYIEKKLAKDDEEIVKKYFNEISK